MNAPLIICADFAPADLARLDALRRAHFPPERNVLPAHLTMFHALPPSTLDDARRQLAHHASGGPPRAFLAGLMNLGSGVAFRVASDDLDAIRGDIADHFHGALTAQDAHGWRPHVTIQNKVTSSVARALMIELERGFRERQLGIAALSLHCYLGGPWERVARYPFRGK